MYALASAEEWDAQDKISWADEGCVKEAVRDCKRIFKTIILLMCFNLISPII